MYGTVDNASFISKLYQNVLHREADAPGRPFMVLRSPMAPSTGPSCW